VNGEGVNRGRDLAGICLEIRSPRLTIHDSRFTFFCSRIGTPKNLPIAHNSKILKTQDLFTPTGSTLPFKPKLSDCALVSVNLQLDRLRACPLLI
jgi:hypothetical protein